MQFKNFTFKEIFAHCTKNEILDALNDKSVMSSILDLLSLLQQIRDRVNEPIIINSAYRDIDHNRRVGGAILSQHIDGQAADIKSCNMQRLYNAICELDALDEEYHNTPSIGQVIVYVPSKYKDWDLFSDGVNWNIELLSQYAKFIHVALPHFKHKSFTPSVKFV